MLKDFKKFILRGNVVDLAVAVVIGAAFSAIVQSLVSSFITPLITGITGSKDGNNVVEGIYKPVILGHQFAFNWGAFVSSVLSFLIIAAVIFFLVIQPINKMVSLSKRSEETPEPNTKKCPHCLSEVPLAATRCAFCTSTLTDKNTAGKTNAGSKK